MSSPVIEALVHARLNEFDKQDAAISREVFERLNETMPPAAEIPEDFSAWTRARGVQAIPARPATVALYVLTRGIALDGVLRIIEDISNAHVGRGLADPTRTWPVPAALTKLVRIDPPRAWPKEEKRRFLELPYELQRFWAKHEERREKEIRRAQTAADRARKELEAIKGRQADVEIQDVA